MESSHLSRASPELRNTVYEHVFTSKYAVTLQDTKCQHALTQTCKQLRHETLAMYYSLTSFNAHLDDGPATPLTRWLKVLGPETACGIDRINVWDLHMLQFTLHGLPATRQIFSRGSLSPKWLQEDVFNDLCSSLGPGTQPDKKSHFSLHPVDIRFADPVLKAVFLALHAMGLGLARFLVSDSPPPSDCPSHPDSNSPLEGEGNEAQAKLTSEYAIVPLRPSPPPPPHSINPWAYEEASSNHDNNDNDDDDSEDSRIYSRVNTLAKQLELSDSASQHMHAQLAERERTVTIREKRRVLVLEFDASGTRLVDFRQAAMSEASHEMLHSVIGAMRNWRAVP